MTDEPEDETRLVRRQPAEEPEDETRLVQRRLPVEEPEDETRLVQRRPVDELEDETRLVQRTPAAPDVAESDDETRLVHRAPAPQTEDATRLVSRRPPAAVPDVEDRTIVHGTALPPIAEEASPREARVPDASGTPIDSYGAHDASADLARVYRTVVQPPPDRHAAADATKLARAQGARGRRRALGTVVAIVAVTIVVAAAIGAIVFFVATSV
jgi:hypothetical protein